MASRVLRPGQRVRSAPRFAWGFGGAAQCSLPYRLSGWVRPLPGCSVVDVQDDQIIRQRDYYDAGEMIYEHLPVLGWAVRGVKRRVRS